MATPLNKTLTREVELNGTTYHVSLTPDPEPSILIREKGKRGRGAETPVTALLKADTPASVNTPAPTTDTGDTDTGLDDFKISFRDVMSKVHVALAEDIPTLQRVRDILRDIYVVTRLADLNTPDNEIESYTPVSEFS